MSHLPDHERTGQTAGAVRPSVVDLLASGSDAASTLDTVSPKFIRWIRNYHIQMHKLTTRRDWLDCHISDSHRLNHQIEIGHFNTVHLEPISGNVIGQRQKELNGVRKNIKYLEAELATRLAAEGLDMENRFYDEVLYHFLHTGV